MQIFNTKKLIKVSNSISIYTEIGGSGPPILMLHGYPQSHMIWRHIAPILAKTHTVVLTNLRGYGFSSKPKGDKSHKTYSKREMAKDQFAVMKKLGFDSFGVFSHDRGARVGFRMAFDFKKNVSWLVVLDMIPTYSVFRHVNFNVANTYYHWFMLAQKYPIPETLITNCSNFFIREKLKLWSKIGLKAYTPKVLQHYIEVSSKKDAIHASCEDYRAATTIDYKQDELELKNKSKIECPVLALWSQSGLMEKEFDVLKVWKLWAKNVSGQAIECGHFLPEENPQECLNSFQKWIKTSKIN